MTDTLSSKKYARIQELKSFKILANKILAENIELQKRSHPSWMNETLIDNIPGIKELIRDINYDLQESRLEEYIKVEKDNMLAFEVMLSQMNAFTFLGKISQFTIPGSIIFDINWLTEITIQDKLDMVFEIKPPDFLANYLQGMLADIKSNILSEIQKKFDQPAEIIKTALFLCNSQNFLSANILLMSAIESIVRQFCIELALVQELVATQGEAQTLISNRISLEGVILRIDWKSDISIPLIELYARYNYVIHPVVQNAKEVIKDSKKHKRDFDKHLDKVSEIAKMSENEDLDEKNREIIKIQIEGMRKILDKYMDPSSHQVMVGLKVFLYFLVRRFKDDRNSLVHGTFEGFDAKWRTYIYLTALKKTWETVQFYRLKYPDMK